MKIPVHLVGGWLGTGKTTTVRHRLEQWAGERVAVLVNDFGEAEIDRTLLDSGPVLTEIRGACVCCTAPEGFTDALALLLDEARPDRIALQPTVVLLDPEAFDPEDPELRGQAEAADVLVANRIDLASPAALERFRTFARSLWPGPFAVHETTHGRLPDTAFAWPPETSPRPSPTAPSGAPHHGARALSRAWDPEEVFDRARLHEALRGASGDLLRLKGLFRTAEGTFLLEIAGGRVHERASPYRRDSRVDLLGRAPERLTTALEALEAARLTPEERAVDPDRIEVVRPDGTRLAFDRAALTALPDPVPDISALVPKRQGAAARLARLLERVGAPPGLEVVVVAADGFATPAVPIEALAEGLILHSRGRAPLRPDAGGPFRLLIPGDAGPGGPCANVKAVVRIVLREPGASEVR